MKTRAFSLLLALVLPLFVLGCPESDKVDSGGVSLVISDFDGRPIRTAVNGAGAAILIDQVVLRSIPVSPDAPTTDLQTIELRSYEVKYTRADRGTRLPPPLVRQIFGTVAPSSTTTIVNFAVALGDQMNNPPISDLLFENGAFDKETGQRSVTLNLELRIFGRTLSGRDIATNPQRFTLELIP